MSGLSREAECGSAAKAAATTTTATEATATAVAAPTAAVTAAVAAGQAVDAGACRVRLAAALDRLAAGQVQASKLGRLERVDVARQLVAIATATFLLRTITSAVIAARSLATKALLRAWSARCALTTLAAWPLAFALVAT